MKPCSVWTVIVNVSVFIVPIRNWNRSGILIKFFIYLVFIVPIRNWNFDSAAAVGASISVFIVPIRNWNLSLSVWPPPAFLVFIVPIRNWNSSSSPRLCARVPCFYSTYKELKPSLLLLLKENQNECVVGNNNWFFPCLGE